MLKKVDQGSAGLAPQSIYSFMSRLFLFQSLDLTHERIHDL